MPGSLAKSRAARSVERPRTEELWDEPSELRLLATHVLDASVGEGFFGDARRMHRDLLADAAAQVLAERGR